MKYFYIYNLDQANYFIMNGLKVVKVGKGGKGDFYVKFNRNEESLKVFDNWCNLCESLK